MYDLDGDKVFMLGSALAVMDRCRWGYWTPPTILGALASFCFGVIQQLRGPNSTPTHHRVDKHGHFTYYVPFVS